jgi:hypothetical protein
VVLAFHLCIHLTSHPQAICLGIESSKCFRLIIADLTSPQTHRGMLRAEMVDALGPAYPSHCLILSGCLKTYMGWISVTFNKMFKLNYAIQ